MKWNDFTKKNYNFFFINKILLKKDNAILLFAKNEIKKIINFIKNNKYEINIIKINNSIDNIITKYANKFFVSYNKVKEQLNNLNYTYLIKWNNNKIYIKSDNLNINNRIKLIVYFIEYLKYISNNNKNITIYLVLTNLKKNIMEII